MLQFLDWGLLPRALLGVLCLLCGNGYIVGINQIYDVDIDTVNKPFLPVAAGTAACAGSCLQRCARGTRQGACSCVILACRLHRLSDHAHLYAQRSIVPVPLSAAEKSHAVQGS